MKEKKELAIFASVMLLIMLIFSFALFGTTGARVVLGILFVSFPFYLILNNFDLEEGERTVFSILMGLTLFSSLAYLLGLLISFRIAIIASFIIFTGAAFLIKKLKK